MGLHSWWTDPLRDAGQASTVGSFRLPICEMGCDSPLPKIRKGQNVWSALTALCDLWFRGLVRHSEACLQPPDLQAKGTPSGLYVRKQPPEIVKVREARRRAGDHV